MAMELILRFGFGRQFPGSNALKMARCWRSAARTWRCCARRSNARREHDHGRRFRGRAGETVPFVLTYDASHLPIPAAIDPAQALADTESSGPNGPADHLQRRAANSCNAR